MKMRPAQRFAAISLTVVLLLSLVLTACGSGSSERQQVRLGEVARTIFYAPQYVALSEGFFEAEGLDVQLQTTPGGDKAMTALLSGVVDIALIGAETSIYVYQQGSEDPVINFAQLTQTDGTFLMVRTQEGTFDWEALKGSTFLGQRKGGMPQMAGEFTLRKHGIDPQKDLNLIQNVDFANIATAFASGTGEYVQLFEPQASIFEQEGRGKVVASFGVESGKLPYTVYMTKSSTIEKQKDVIQKFTKAIYKAQRWVDQQDPEKIASSIMPFFKDADHDIVVSAVKRYKEQGSFAIDPIVDELEWNNLLDVLRSAGELKSDVSSDKIVNNSFADQAKVDVK